MFMRFRDFLETQFVAEGKITPSFRPKSRGTKRENVSKIHLLLFITKKYAYIRAKNLVNNAQIHSFLSTSIH